MAMVVKNNISAVRTLNTLNGNSGALQKSLAKVSSGMKINSAQDDASGYAISERMRVRIRSLDQANQNTQNDSSLMKTAEGAVANTVELLRALKEKAINAANDSNTDEDRQTIQKELDQFIDQIDDNALVQFNGKYLVDGSKNNAVSSTKTILLNQALDKSTATDTALTDLRNRAGDSLEIQATDKYQVSWVVNGKINTASGTITSDTKLSGLVGLASESANLRAADGNGLIGIPDTTQTPLSYAFAKTVQATKAGQTGASDYIATSDYFEDDTGAATWSTRYNSGDIFTVYVGVYPNDGSDNKDKFVNDVYTPDKSEGVAVTALTAGVQTQISGFNISIMDSEGNVKKAANAALDQFKQYQMAENQTGDMSLNFHIGSEANVAIKVGLSDMRAEALGLKGSTGDRILVTTKENANASINVIENALTKALDQQTTIGAIEARLEYTATNLTTSSENVQAAESTIRDADMAKEMTNYTKNNVLLQAAQAMLAQANQNSSAVLSLLQ